MPAVVTACKGGHIQILKIISSRPLILPDVVAMTAYKYALEGGKVEILEWLHKTVSSDVEKTNIYMYITAAGKLHQTDVLNYLQKNVSPKSTRPYEVYEASEKGQVELLGWYQFAGYQVNENCWTCAARLGQVDTLHWLHENNIKSNVDACAIASRKGYLKIVELLRRYGVEWDYRCVRNAAAGGHIKTLEWLLKNGAEVDESACLFAASRGKLEALKYLIDNGAPWNPMNCRKLALGKATFDWLDTYCSANDVTSKSSSSQNYFRILPGDIQRLLMQQYLFKGLYFIWDPLIMSTASTRRPTEDELISIGINCCVHGYFKLLKSITVRLYNVPIIESSFAYGRFEMTRWLIVDKTEYKGTVALTREARDWLRVHGIIDCPTEDPTVNLTQKNL